MTYFWKILFSGGQLPLPLRLALERSEDIFVFREFLATAVTVIRKSSEWYMKEVKWKDIHLSYLLTSWNITGSTFDNCKSINSPLPHQKLSVKKISLCAKMPCVEVFSTLCVQRNSKLRHMNLFIKKYWLEASRKCYLWLSVTFICSLNKYCR